MSSVPTQCVMTFGTWGGWRPGAGRKPSRKPSRHVAHRRRPRINGREPLHITLRLSRELGNLRTKQRHQVIRKSFVAACDLSGFRIVDWSIQHDHIHLIAEARDGKCLARGMQSFTVRVARGLNRLLGRHGTVFEGRYHVHVLKTPREVRNAKAYVLNNRRRHLRQSDAIVAERWYDPFSSWAWSDGWRDCPRAWTVRAREGPESTPPVAAPRTWLLRVGWRRRGLIRIDEVPKGNER